MNSYNINKGIGRTVEFKGLKAQYLFIFAGGLLGNPGDDTVYGRRKLLHLPNTWSWRCFPNRVADLFTEQKVWRTRTDEDSRQ